jgi:RNA polymerase sigma-70 factor (ECF subfamily)
VPIDRRLLEHLHRQGRGERWRVSTERFAAALEPSIGRAGADAKDVKRVLSALHLEDLALACACADGDEQAWDHFVLEYRPHLYRAADALDPTGGARELADSLYAELFGLRERAGARQSLFRYFHGRSSLTTWLRAVLAQRHVDRVRVDRKLEPLPDEESPAAFHAPPRAIEPDRARYLRIIRLVFEAVVASLAPRDRLRLGCYYAQELTLAQTGRLLGEHEATASRQLSRTRQQIRHEVERRLRDEHALTEAEVADCFASIAADAGPLDLGTLMASGSSRKESAIDRSKTGERV